MRIDHLVLNIDKKYQTDIETIEAIQKAGLPYEPKWGKGTKGFKVSNIWIGTEYFELTRILKPDGGGWIPEWVDHYHQGHRGLICLMLDIPDLDKYDEQMRAKNIAITPPVWLQFKWGFKLFTRTHALA